MFIEHIAKVNCVIKITYLIYKKIVNKLNKKKELLKFNF